MNATIEIKGTSAFLEIGKSDISGDFKQSPNGQFFMICDTLYSPSGNNDKECAVVFTADYVCYKKAIPNDVCVDIFYVFDDGSSLIVTEDEDLIRLDGTGKQITKRKICSIESHGFLDQILYIIGDNEEGDTVLSLYDFQNNKFISRTIPNIEYDEDDEDNEDQYSCDVELEIVNNNFVFVYENKTEVIAFDLQGNKIVVPESDRNTAIKNIIKREEMQKTERAISQYEYWTKRLLQKHQEGNTEEIDRAESEVKKYKDLLPSDYFTCNRTLDISQNCDIRENAESTPMLISDPIIQNQPQTPDFAPTMQNAHIAPSPQKPQSVPLHQRVWKLLRTKFALILALFAVFGIVSSERTTSDLSAALLLIGIAAIIVLSAVKKVKEG